MKIWVNIALFVSLLICGSVVNKSALQAQETAGDQSAVILVYHRFGEDEYPSTNIRLEQFEAQIEYLKAGGFTFLSLPEITKRLAAKESLPERTVAVTVDDAYASALSEGWPRLKAAGIPLTLFVSTGPVDQGVNGYLSWDEIRALQADGVVIGHHGKDHLHLPHAGLDAAKADLLEASERFKSELGAVPAFFAWPYGEHAPELTSMAQSQGFTAGFAQISGPAGFTSHRMELPRFPVNEFYGGMDRFRLVANTKSLPLGDITPKNPWLSQDSNPPLHGFTVTDPDINLNSMACYPSHISEPAVIERLPNQRFEIRFDEPFPFGRSRINCTARDRDGRWFWYGRLFIVPGGTLD